jgi:hypothetical protein
VNPETLLLRQIHPSFVQLGRPTSQAFRPTPKDENLLSVDDGSKIPPRASWERFTSTTDSRSAGVMAVTCAECDEQELPVIADGTPFPEHCSIDFSDLTESLVKKKAKVLVRHAIQRDWLFKALQQA